ncbi:MAG: ester cyclase, partial [Paracoccaceae bacterium]
IVNNGSMPSGSGCTTKARRGVHSMTSPKPIQELFNLWEKVWHEKSYEFASDCVAESYTRNDENGIRTVTREEYLAEMQAIHTQRPDIRVVVFDHDLGTDRAWFRFMFRWTDINGDIVTRAGMQVYRIENGRIAETWIAMQPIGSAWPDDPQTAWTAHRARPQP